MRIPGLVLAGLLAIVASVAFGQTPEARVVVPDTPGGALVAGCYRADRVLFGPYRLTFCLERRGTYSVRGGGLACDGRLTWTASGSTVTIGLRRQSCGNGRAWAAAEIVCRPRSLVSLILEDLLRDLAGEDRRTPRVVIPDRPTIGRLACSYYPTVPGVRSRDFFANRLLREPR
jgi:hypothetical protein